MARVKVFGPAKDPRKASPKHGSIGSPFVITKRLVVSLADGRLLAIDFRSAEDMEELAMNLLLAAGEIREHGGKTPSDPGSVG